MSDEESLARLFFETAHLKRMPRTGWIYAGVPAAEIESVAEHSFNAAIIAYVLALREGADPHKCAVLALFHDTQESRITDISYLGKQYLTPKDNTAVTAEQTADLPAPVRDPIRLLVEEFEAQDSLEARLARDADKLECVVQAADYRTRHLGQVQEWIESNTALLWSEAAKGLAAAAATMDAHDWWRAVFESGA
ncbi:MAG TPA: HD domain-containing protein [Mycobacteriales bacterium]|nr:HD domain-containing protein [Mycobacteriales bacterium]